MNNVGQTSLETPSSVARNTALLVIDQLVGGYNAGVVLHGVSLSVRAGEFVCLVGPNGAGKTTLLRAIYQMIRIDSGSITLDGRSVQAMKPYEIGRQGVAHVPEGRGLFPQMSVREHLRLGGYLTDTKSRREGRMDEVLELFPKLRSRMKQAVNTMSGGEQQMVAIARALMTCPRLLLLDEPSLGLSPKLAEETFASLRRLREVEPELAMLIVEQRVLEALDLCDRAFVLDSGKVALEGPAQSVKNDVDRMEVAFLGTGDA
jgi:branched-chain amino acid transport system ATP-binding protein